MEAKNQPELKSSKSIKLLRLIVICSSIVGLGYYVKQSYTKFKIKPEILINEKYVQTSDIPFPAVTICPPIIINSKSLNVTKYQHEYCGKYPPSQEDYCKMYVGSYVCRKHSLCLPDPLNQVICENEVETLFQMSPSGKEVQICYLSSKDTDYGLSCDLNYFKLLTFHGYCYTFNILHDNSIFHDNVSPDFHYVSLTRHDYKKKFTRGWSLEDGYKFKAESQYPYTARLGEIEIRASVNNDEISNFCENRDDLYKLIFHLPNEIPTKFHDYAVFELKKNTHVRITATVKNHDDSVKAFEMKHRNCYFKDERQLKFFKFYTKSNCEQECFANFTLNVCGCVMFFSPRTSEMKVCKRSKADRLYDPCFDSYSRLPSIYYDKEENLDSSQKFPCDCLPTCTEINYKALNDGSFNRKDSDMRIITEGSIKLSFSGAQIKKTTNYVTYQLQNFISDIGGLAGLFLGFSLLSLFEVSLKIIEFIIIKVKSIFQRNKKEQMCEHKNYATVLELSFIHENSEDNESNTEEIFIVPKRNFQQFHYAGDDENKSNVEISTNI